jgi:hypothetical protein
MSSASMLNLTQPARTISSAGKLVAFRMPITIAIMVVFATFFGGEAVLWLDKQVIIPAGGSVRL